MPSYFLSANSLLREQFTHNFVEHTFIGKSVCALCGHCKLRNGQLPHQHSTHMHCHTSHNTPSHMHTTHPHTCTQHTLTHAHNTPSHMHTTHPHTCTHKHHANKQTNTQMKGIVKQGVHCKDCGISCHKQCKD